MSQRITLEEAEVQLPALLNRVRVDRETFVIFSNGEEIAQLSPVAHAQPQEESGHPVTAGSYRTAADLLRGIDPVDDESAEQIARAIRESREEARKLDATGEPPKL